MATKQPNILILWGDDVGYWNISRNSDGMMGYRTPNIDRIANEGVKFTDWYGQQSCTAGRAAFITGQNPLRTGLTKVGLPGSTLDFKRKTRPLPNCSSRSATPPVSSARTISAIGMNFCRPCTDLTSSSAISIT
jgi:arylsulfatase A-like enzyme